MNNLDRLEQLLMNQVNLCLQQRMCVCFRIFKFKKSNSRSYRAEERCNISLQRGGEMTFINESGLYSLIIRSNKEEAKPFRKWITSEILPSIRKNGYYVNNKFATNHLTPTKVRASIEWVKGVREVLNLNIPLLCLC